MELHTPGGVDWFSALLYHGQVNRHESTEHEVLVDVSAEALDGALEAMRDGRIEFVTLVDGDEFAQAAGDGDGPYVLEHYRDGKPTVTVSNAPFELVSVVLGKYRSGDGSWRQDLGAPESTATPSQGLVTEPKRGGFLSRLRGK